MSPVNNPGLTEAKRSLLAKAASRLIHQKGFNRTTLADIAKDANVALGSVYYYFKSKDDIAEAVIEKRLKDIDTLLQQRDEISDPRHRLLALIDVWVGDRDIDARYGCPVGSLCYELAKGRGPLSGHAARPFRMLLEWCERQFKQIISPAQVKTAALHLIVTLQGASLIANAMGDPALILDETNYLKTWIEAL